VKSRRRAGTRATLARVSGKDLAVAASLILGFATFVTAHVWLAARLVVRAETRLRGLIALLVPPLAPLWGYRQGFRKGAILWVVSLLAYVVALLVARFS